MHGAINGHEILRVVGRGVAGLGRGPSGDVSDAPQFRRFLGADPLAGEGLVIAVRNGSWLIEEERDLESGLVGEQAMRRLAMIASGLAMIGSDDEQHVWRPEERPEGMAQRIIDGRDLPEIEIVTVF